MDHKKKKIADHKHHSKTNNGDIKVKEFHEMEKAIDHDIEMKAKHIKKKDDSRIFLWGTAMLILLFVIIIGVPKLYDYYESQKEVPQGNFLDEKYTEALTNKNTSDHYNYNGYAFIKIDNFWFTRIQRGEQPYDIPFYFDPNNLSDIKLENNSIRVLSKMIAKAPKAYDTVFLSVQPNMSSMAAIAAIEIGRMVGNRYNLLNYSTKSALTAPLEGQEDFPVRNCSNAFNRTAVIEFQISDKTEITSAIGPNGLLDCIIIQGPNEKELIRAADKLSYVLLGIINPQD